MGFSDPRTPPRGRAAAAVRTLAIPVAVLLAGAVCAVTLVALSLVTVPDARVVLGEDEPAAAPAPVEESEPAEETEEPAPPPSEEPAPEPSDEPGAAEGEPEPVPEPSPAPEPADPEEPAAAEPESVPPSAYDGSTTSVGVFRVVVEAAYTDPTITNGTGSYAEAPAGWEYHVYRLNVTNEGSSPVIFDSSGTVGTTTDGRRFVNDIDAEHTVAYDYFWFEIDPGETVTTHIMFLAPVGTEFAHVLVAGQSDLRPG
ncbi:DUF4352 domain-containing protein [Nocardiopsis exhalans]|uniref:DUF4352 domain-containing protein n=1 Tax=Nocardiopsis exhalans TaxID=163604 RepID=A0ABY5D5V0_9ACTN|nr:DUF4352 domain-containing protein [Nocardiopsis exhalans]USY19756.1 DUF4352 domain-containing protein [Nocardiopsis exhalans]